MTASQFVFSDARLSATVQFVAQSAVPNYQLYEHVCTDSCFKTSSFSRQHNDNAWLFKWSQSCPISCSSLQPFLPRTWMYPWFYKLFFMAEKERRQIKKNHSEDNTNCSTNIVSKIDARVAGLNIHSCSLSWLWETKNSFEPYNSTMRTIPYKRSRLKLLYDGESAQEPRRANGRT